MTSEPKESTLDLKDLRGVQHRHVHRDDSVIITGAEYLRKSRAADKLEVVVTDETIERGARALYALMPQAKRECFEDWEVAVPVSARNNREQARAVLRAALEGHR